MARQSKENRENIGAVIGQKAHLKATEEALKEAGKIAENTEEDELSKMREKLKDTFDHFPDIDFLWVVKDEALSAFFPNDLVLADNHANHVKCEIVKVPRK